MKGIDPTVTTHKQKRRKLGFEGSQAVNDEVDKLLSARSFVEVKYPDWLANPVVVKKKNGKWRVRVDITDLNKACPKDSFSLPRIDQLVEATAGNELLTFMDVFSGYNQILMHKDDREKTSFITDRGTYCYKVMPFGLKNAGATYQRLVNKMFAEQLGRTMEVYIDDMLVKSRRANDHITHLRKCFDVLNKYGIKLNPAKCTFAVKSGEFLGYFVTRKALKRTPSKLRSTDKCLPFYQLLKTKGKFEWNEACHDAFSKLKSYIAVSESAVRGVLVKDDRGEQRPIFYISKSLDDTETRYPTVKKVALAVVTSSKSIWPVDERAIELSEYDIEYRTRPAAKSKVLVELLIELPLDVSGPTSADPTDDRWTLHVDGASSHFGSGVGIREIFLSSLWIRRNLRTIFSSSVSSNQQCRRLIANQFSGEPMAAYLDVVKILSKRFDEFELVKIPRGDNAQADALAALASTSDPDLRRIIPVESIKMPSIEGTRAKTCLALHQPKEIRTTNRTPTSRRQCEPPSENDPTDWQVEIRSHLADGDMPTNKWAKRRLKAKAAHYTLMKDHLLRWTASGALLLCIHGDDTERVMIETLEEAGGNHSGGRALALRIKKHGHYLPTMMSDCEKWRIKLRKSTPRYPQGNGQAEATNKIILDGLKKRLDAKKGAWVDELDGVLWSYRTTPRQATNQTPFSLAYGMEAMAPTKVSSTSLRRTMLVQDTTLNSQMLLDQLDELEEERDKALLRIQNYQLAAAKYYNKKVHNRNFDEGDLVLRKVFENTTEPNAVKMGANWEGPYQISNVVHPGVYELLTMSGEPVPRSWNSMHIKSY
ncbi:PREDICTED: uncharacterized protein LOC104753544 [Camelina sativa]|uniref:Uncharacterized protein LOC104753544 n=1 Tax=Camelina sativa TaxID=90675 RepID=A0ABM0WPB1_CAMSA|nr:PREDICTED: uncharacterized protein LOC104753544 [Camelina sativa]